MSDAVPVFATILHFAAGELLLAVAALLALSSADDLFVDLIYFERLLRRRLTIYRHHPRARADAFDRAEPGWMAIIVPAWNESAVIGAMLRDLTARLEYRRYRVFIGVYPNDPATSAAIRAVGDDRLAIITCARPGPTTKADCLNHLWRAVLADEAARGMEYKAVVLHDAEDVVAARELAVFDHLMPRLAMVQLPVLPLPDKGSRWISGHYADEFAETHGKDLIVREALGATVPSAGVACAIDRAMLGRIADMTGGQPFDAACMTEDYELGYRIKALGGRAALVRIADAPGGGVIATREHFPATLETALRQKTRWLLGIALSGWDRLGWPGGIADRYFMLRDRKAIPSALLTAAAYAASLLALLDAVVRGRLPELQLGPLVPAGSLLAALLAWNGAMLLWRLALRAGFTARAYGWREGLRAVPRAAVANYINAAAAWRALVRYLRLLAGREQPIWDHTAHRFPETPP